MVYYLSFRKLDLALASTPTFTTSSFVVLLTPLVLREKIGGRRAIATVLGFKCPIVRPTKHSIPTIFLVVLEKYFDTNVDLAFLIVTGAN